MVGGAGLAAAGVSLWFAVRGARRISRRLETLRDAADVLTRDQLPDVMRRLSAGEDVDAGAAAPPLAAGAVHDDEIGQVGRSFNAARLAAVEAAVQQAGLRRGQFAVLLTIARRNQALVHRQLKLVDTLERRTEDPDVLRELFRIDHLTTRMRRHAESLIILSGAAPGRRWRRPVPLADVVASAVGEIEDYARVVVPPMPEVGVAADAVADVVHLVAELLENATVFSPPHTQVTLRSGRVGSGFVLEIDDRGLGLDADARDGAYATLTAPDAFDPTRHDRLGLYVVGRLAARHGIEVSLRDSPYGGTTALVRLPSAVLAEVSAAKPTAAAPEPVSAGGGRTAGTLGAVRELPVRNARGQAGRGLPLGAADGDVRRLPSADGNVRGLPSGYGDVPALPTRKRTGPSAAGRPAAGAGAVRRRASRRVRRRVARPGPAGTRPRARPPHPYPAGLPRPRAAGRSAGACGHARAPGGRRRDAGDLRRLPARARPRPQGPARAPRDGLRPGGPGTGGDTPHAGEATTDAHEGTETDDDR
ncbi:sensor histidine kinase [Streptomyces lasalocidi]